MDRATHRRRAEARILDIAGPALPSWAEIKARRDDALPEPRLVIGTATLSVDDAVAVIARRTDEIRTAASP